MVYIILGNGFEEIEAITPCDILRRGGVSVCFASVENSASVEGAHGISLIPDMAVSGISPKEEDCLVIPGGMGGVNSIKSSEATMALLKRAVQAGCTFSAICAGPSVLAALGILDGKSITCYPGCEDLMGNAACDTTHSALVNENIITARAPGAAIDFGLALLSHLSGGDIAEKVRQDLVY